MATDVGRADRRSLRGFGPTGVDTRGLLEQLLRRPRALAVGVLVAGAAAASQFAAIGLSPPSVKFESLAHSIASTQLVLGQTSALSLGQGPAAPDPFATDLPRRAAALADMAGSPEVLDDIARAAGLPASRIAVDAPLWTQLQRDQQWDTGPKRASQIVVEGDPYRITLNNDSPLIDVSAQAPTAQVATRLAQAVTAGLNTYLSNLEASAGTPPYARYNVRQAAPVSVQPPSSSPANVAGFTFLTVFVLWCGLVLGVSGLARDLRTARKRSKVHGSRERSSGSQAGGGAKVSTG
jgi:hypothetical protein